MVELEESTEDTVERIAKAWHEAPCPPDEVHCNPDLHVWETAHPEDKEWGRQRVRFVLTELGLG
jgi:hypothetical protein